MTEILMDNGRPVVKLALGPVSIIWLETDPGPCACGREIGTGPVGFHLDPGEPVCDNCLLDLHSGLGQVMWMTHVVRDLAREAADNPQLADQFKVALMGFAKIYNISAAWPFRKAAAVDFMEELKERIARIPWDALTKMLGPVQ